MDRHEQILRLVRMKGPLLPSQINKELDTNVLFASAMLSELVDRKVLRLTNAKVGGSPLYYLPGQEARLDSLEKYLHEKERRAFSALKSAKVLRDSEVDPVVRVALREIKDFSVPLEVTLEGNVEIFWKWHLVDDVEAETIIKRILKIDVPENIVDPEISQTESSSSVKNGVVDNVKKSEDFPVEEKTHFEDSSTQEVVNTKDCSKSVQECSEEVIDPPRVAALTSKKSKAKYSKKKDVQKNLADDDISVVFPEDDDFFEQIYNYFQKNGIDILDCKVVRKSSDMEFIIDLPTNIGSIQFFCKAKSKQKVNDGDLSSVFIQSQQKKLPVLFLTPGELTKKAQELLDSEFGTMAVRKMG